MDKNFKFFIFCVFYTLFLVAVAIIYGYNQGVAHAIQDTKIVQNGDVIRFYLDDQEWNFILERR